MNRSFLAPVLFACVASAATAGAAVPGPYGVSVDSSLLPVPRQVTETGLSRAFPLWCVDTNHDGRDEVVMSGFGDGLWRTAEYDSARGTFTTHTRASMPYRPLSTGDPLIADGEQGTATLVASLDPSGAPKVFVTIENPVKPLPSIARYDVATGALEYVMTGVTVPVATAVDLDGDGVSEILTQGVASQLAVYDATLTKRLSSFETPPSANGGLAVGHFDGGPHVEVVTGPGQVFELGPDSLHLIGSIDEKLNGEPIFFLAAADLDGDGRDEIIATYGSTIQAIDFAHHKALWSVTPSVNPSAQLYQLKIADMNGDGRPDILVGQTGAPSAPGNIIVLDGPTGHELRVIQHPDISFNGLGACDLDGDGKKEILAALGRPVIGPEHLYVYDFATGQLKSRSFDEAGPIRAVALADADDDGHTELVYSADGVIGSGDVKLHALDASTFAFKWDSPDPLLAQTGTGSIHALAAGDALGTGHTALVVGTTHDGFGQLWIVDGATRTLIRGVQLELDRHVDVLALADIDGVGHQQIVAGLASNAGAGAAIEAVDGASGTTLWHADLGQYGTIPAMRIVDLNHDSHPDIIVSTPSVLDSLPGVLIVDGATHAVRSLPTKSTYGLEVMDVAGDATPEIIVGHMDGSIEVLDASSGAVLSKRTPCSSTVNAISRSHLPGAGANDVLFACNKQVGWMAGDTGDFKFITSPLGSVVGSGNVLFSGGGSAADATITVTTTSGVKQLRPVAALAPYVLPIGANSGLNWGAHWGNQSTGTITFGTFDGSPATLEIVQQPAHGIATVDATSGRFTYQADAKPYKGVDLLVVRARTAGATSPPTALALTMDNSAPFMTTDPLSLDVSAGAAGTVPLHGSDFDSDPVTYEVTQAPTMGQVQVSAGGVATYTANATASGKDSFTVRVFDGLAYSLPVTVSVNVSAQTSPPVTPPSTTPPPQTSGSSGGGGGGAIDPLMLVGLASVLLFVRRRALHSRRYARVVVRAPLCARWCGDLSPCVRAGGHERAAAPR